MSHDLSTVDPAWAWSAYEPSDQCPWDLRRAAHARRRLGFGANLATLRADVARPPREALAQMLLPAGDAPTRFAADMDAMAQTVLAAGDANALSAWWLYRLLHTPDPLLEKLTVFWHGHFATSAEKVTSARLMLAQNELLRRHARGDFAALVEGVSRDPAMMIYLDAQQNRKRHPNENFARELLELFCLGLGAYTEKDIQQLARCLTGYELRQERFFLNEYEHDRRMKTVFGQSAEWDGPATVRLVLDHPALPPFIVGKLFRYFVCDEPVPSPALLAPLNDLFRQSDLRLAPVLERLLSSNLFFSEHALGRKVRSPVEFGVGLMRAFDGACNMKRLVDALSHMGQKLLFPPNVKGWDGGRAWLNASTLLARANWTRQTLLAEETRFGGGKLADLAEQQDARSPEQVVEWLETLLTARPLPAPARQTLAAAVRDAPDRERGLRDAIHALCLTPECHLA